MRLILMHISENVYAFRLFSFQIVKLKIFSLLNSHSNNSIACFHMMMWQNWFGYHSTLRHVFYLLGLSKSLTNLLAKSQVKLQVIENKFTYVSLV